MELFLFLIFTFPFVASIINIVNIVKKKKMFVFEVLECIIGNLLFLFIYSLCNGGNYEKTLYVYYDCIFHEALNPDYILHFIIIWILGTLSYFILKFNKAKKSPIIKALLLSFMYMHIIMIILLMIQFAKGFLSNSEAIISIFFIYLFLINYLMLYVNLIISIVKMQAIGQKDITYKNRILNYLNNILCKGSNLAIFPMLLALPIMLVLVLILIIFGQTPDSFIKVFTETSDWTLSEKISPPPIEYKGHYLCTVSIRGHKKLVKPLRYGIRQGKKIVVNRQLCIANAFEDLIAEKFPVFHKHIRHIYDTYGYPVSKHIKKAWVADIVYIIMKPLEWVFLIVLYTFDTKPENRISIQYISELKKK